jgi:ATP-dependent DNA ligase
MASSIKHGITLVYIPYWWDETKDSLSSTLHQFMPDIFPKTDSPPIPTELPLDYKSKKNKPVPENKNIMNGYDLNLFEDEVDVEGWFMSEKLDGIRAYWDGKTFWSKNAKIINVPESFKNLPSYPLDGELWAGYGENEKLLASLKMSCGVYRKTNLDWTKIIFCVFDAPGEEGTYDKRHLFLQNNFTQYCNINISLVPMQICKGKDHLEKLLGEIVEKGGEGVMIYDPKLPYQPGRCKNVLKV